MHYDKDTDDNKWLIRAYKSNHPFHISKVIASDSHRMWSEFLKTENAASEGYIYIFSRAISLMIRYRQK